MYELLLRFETLFSTLSTPVLLGTGAGLLVAGVLLWLFGQRFGAVIIGLVGAAVGAVLGLMVGQWLDFHLLVGMGIGALVLAIAFILLRNTIVLVLTVAIFAAISGAGYLSTQLDALVQTSHTDANSPSIYGTELPSRVQTQAFTNMLTPAERLTYFENLTSAQEGFSEKLRAILQDTWEMIKPQFWRVTGIALGGAAAAILLIWVVKKIVILLAYAVVGSTTLLFGVQVLLLGIGIGIVSKLPRIPWLLPAIFGGLVLVGWVSQAITGRPAKKTKSKTKADPNDGQDEEYEAYDEGQDDGDDGGDD